MLSTAHFRLGFGKEAQKIPNMLTFVQHSCCIRGLIFMQLFGCGEHWANMMLFIATCNAKYAPSQVYAAEIYSSTLACCRIIMTNECHEVSRGSQANVKRQGLIEVSAD